ncbi:MAG: hypothetical protein ACI4S4_06075, partial [Candidatus Ornithospirochaeta sp.]
ALLRAGDPYSLDWGLGELLKAMKRNMDETAEALDEDFFPSDTVVYIAQCAKEATEYTGISSLSKALARWVERHPEEETVIGPYAEEAAKAGESVPF